jgi:hypothetical protein
MDTDKPHFVCQAIETVFFSQFKQQVPIKFEEKNISGSMSTEALY